MANYNSDQWLPLSSPAGEAAIDPTIGNIPKLQFRIQGREITPLHTAPWVREPGALDETTCPPVEQHLAGDFLCAPFGLSNVEDAPPHGWPANSSWTVQSHATNELHLCLDRPVMGARIENIVHLAGDASLLYQTHLIKGGEQGLTIAHHPMVRLQSTGKLCTSPKQAILTPTTPLEPGRHKLANGIATNNLKAIPGSDSKPVDLTTLPIADRHEDFATLIEAPGQQLGWTAILRHSEDDIVFFLKDPKILPVTMTWHSNAGRNYPPWNGRHHGVIGIEDGCAAGSDGHRAALNDNPISAYGVPTALPLAANTIHRIAHVIGAICRPEGWNEISDIEISGETLIFHEVEGAKITLPFRAGFF